MKKLEIRGVLLDPARTIEKRNVYRDLIPMLGTWGYNTLFWHFTDDQGCRMEFPSHPELATAHAYSQEETRALIQFAENHGLSIVPEIECFGHTEFITHHKKYAHLLDGVEGKLFSSLCPFHEESKALLKDLLTDVAQTFPSPYIHVGMDEVGFGKHPLSKNLLKKKEKWELFAEHICWLHETVSGLGKTMMIWGDHLLGLTSEHVDWADQLDEEGMNREIIHRIPKDIIICDWHYGAKPDPETLDFFLNNGFKVIATPATFAHGSLVHPRQTNLDNLRIFTKEAKARTDRGVIGVMNTVWCPFRNFPGATLHAIALEGQQLLKTRVVRKKFDEAFLKDTFGLQDAIKVGEAIETLYRINPHLDKHAWMNPTRAKDCKEFDLEEAKLYSSLEPEAKVATNVLMDCEDRVTMNRNYYEDIVFAATYFSETLGRGMRIHKIACLVRSGKKMGRAGDQPASRKQYQAAMKLLKKEQNTAKSLHRLGKSRWSKSRYPRTNQNVYGQLMDRLEGCELFMCKLVKQLEGISKTGKGRFDVISIAKDSGLC